MDAAGVAGVGGVALYFSTRSSILSVPSSTIIHSKCSLGYVCLLKLSNICSINGRRLYVGVQMLTNSGCGGGSDGGDGLFFCILLVTMQKILYV